MKTRAQCKKDPETSSAFNGSKRKNKKDGHGRHRACRKTRREFLICPEGGNRGDVQLIPLDDNQSSDDNALSNAEEGSILSECHLCHDGGIKCILGHRVPKESIDVIRSLPTPPSAAVPAIPPKRTQCCEGRDCPILQNQYTLVLDIDETLVHCSTDERDSDCDFVLDVAGMPVFARTRPNLHSFLEEASKIFEIITFTAGHHKYASALLNAIDPEGGLIQHRIYRDCCYITRSNEGSRYVKNLNILGRDLDRTVIVDNSLEAFGFQLENGILIGSWFGDDTEDDELMRLLAVLRRMVDGRESVPDFIRKTLDNAGKFSSLG